MPPYRLLAADLDGTLLDSRFQVPEANRRALGAAVAAGVIVVIVTGRRFPAALEALEGVGLDPWLILNGGALVKEGRAGPVASRSFLSRETAVEVLRVGRTAGGVPVVHDGPDAEGNLLLEPGAPSHPSLALYLERAVPPPRRVPSLVAALERDPAEIMFAATLAEVDVIERALAGALPGKVNLARTAYPRRDFAILDVLAPDCSKAVALGFVATRCGLSLAETLAIGDNWNDLGMLEAAGFSVLMGNAPPELRARGFAVTAGNDDGGFALALDKYLLRPSPAPADLGGGGLTRKKMGG